MIERLIMKLANFLLCNIKFLFIKTLHMRKFNYHLINYCSFFSTICVRNGGSIKIKKNATVEKNTLISALRNGNISIGRNAFINRNCYIVSHEKVEIGDDVMIGPNTVIVDHDHLIEKTGAKRKTFNTADIIIGNNTWIGANCIILKGATIGKNCIIGAGSIVKGKVQDNVIYFNKRDTVVKELKDRK